MIEQIPDADPAALSRFDDIIDVRSPGEFAEDHIPGAINLRIRDINADSIVQLPPSDLYVAYCVKDFRGFEMARKLRDHRRMGIGNGRPGPRALVQEHDPPRQRGDDMPRQHPRGPVRRK